MLTVQYAKGLPNMQINAADPGATNTDLVCDFRNNSKTSSVRNQANNYADR